MPASSLDPDSDLGERLVTVEVGALPPEAWNRFLAGLGFGPELGVPPPPQAGGTA